MFRRNSLFCSSADVNRYKSLKLAQARTEEFVSTAVDKVKVANMSERSRESTLRHAQNMKTSETQGLPYILHLKTTANYMVTVNIDTNDGLVNGATGQLMRIDHCMVNGSLLVTGLWIKFTDATVGTIARSKVRGNYHPDWTPIYKTARVFQCGSPGHSSVDQKQFPVVPAEAITIYKSQGATFTKVTVHLKRGIKRASLYEGCSRATSGDFVPPTRFGATHVQVQLAR